MKKLYEIIRKKKQLFPKIKRLITERRSIETMLLLLLLVGIGMLVPKARMYEHQVQDAQKAKETLQSNLHTWVVITQKYPTYRDAYFEAAMLAYRLGDRKTEYKMLDSLAAVDPNFVFAQKLANLQ